MAQIQVSNLTFSYEGSADDVLENVSFNIDTNWKLGFIGRNGKGKTTLLRLLMGDYKYQGSITSSTYFDYFPYKISQKDVEKTASELLDQWKPGIEEWQVLVQMNQIQIDAECLYRPIKTLSHGERTRVMLAVLFSGENEFLLIDEPTNHLDQVARDIVKNYLASKKGFILVSHDRDLLDAVCDHVLVMNRRTIEVQSGNFSSWWENKEKSDAFAKAENEKHLKEIGKLKAAADRTGRWADKSEGSKIGFDPIKETDRSISTRSYIGAKTKKMQARVKAYEKRVDREIEEKEGLLQDIENVVDLKVMPLEYHKNILVDVQKLSLSYKGSTLLFKELTFQIKQGDRIVISGHNGCGKSSIIKAILKNNDEDFGDFGNLEIVDGNLNVGSGLVISYINQDTSFLKGTIEDFCQYRGLDRSLFLAILRQLDFKREQFSKNMEDFSEGQKKKVLIAASLITPAHLYIWDEPLNYIDVFSRMQIEKLILDACPTMLIVEHDARFQEKVATEVIRL
ncbi:lincosamide and streptogramin A transport system ATP-binding/permease protein [Pseudobutyrivibrio sp. C4]|uniref:ribosomal protection-like ABC-F family protein n=1 Tax=Pseudobutyrivibrio sp. C4 TaxID=1520803 RepID=UPI0008D83512|nr:ABC-F type ribosomal protection protein [Pseudobutyrivibrio sp. C4]SES79453.1 lincosamide and streptogramin A transport system ATP-binding/permease protein [Pseudobutyrivibrio sp. C4]